MKYWSITQELNHHDALMNWIRMHRFLSCLIMYSDCWLSLSSSSITNSVFASKLLYSKMKSEFASFDINHIFQEKACLALAKGLSLFFGHSLGQDHQSIFTFLVRIEGWVRIEVFGRRCSALTRANYNHVKSQLLFPKIQMLCLKFQSVFLGPRL
jgi:hypothetical protein